MPPRDGESTSTVASKAVTRGVFWVFEHPPKFQGKIRHTKTDQLLVTKFSKVTTGYRNIALNK